LTVSQVAGKPRQPVSLTFGPTVFDGDVPPLDLPHLPKPATERIHVVRKPGGRSVGEIPDNGQHLPLRVRRERAQDEPTCNSANERSPVR